MTSPPPDPLDKMEKQAISALADLTTLYRNNPDAAAVALVELGRPETLILLTTALQLLSIHHDLWVAQNLPTTED